MINLNLLPPEIKHKVKQAKQSANVFSICLVVIVIFVALNILLIRYNSSLLQTELASYKTDISNANKGLTNFDKLENQALFLNDRAELVTTIQNSASVWSQILQDLINDAPTNVQFVSLTADPAKSPNFVLQGKTVSERDAIKFKDKLESSTFFKAVSFKSSSTTTDKDSASQLSFTLEFNLEKATTKAAK